MAIIKMKKIRVLTQITNLLISLLRGTPVIVQLYVAFFGIPMMFKAINQQFGTNLAVANISGFVYAMIALGLNQSGSVSYTHLAEKLDKKHRGKGAESDVDDVVADENRGEQLVKVLQQL